MNITQEKDLSALQHYWAQTHGQPGPSEIPISQLMQLAYLTDRAEKQATGKVSSGRTWYTDPHSVVYSPEIRRVIADTSRYQMRPSIIRFLPTAYETGSPWCKKVEHLADSLSPLGLKGYVRHLPEVAKTQPGSRVL